MACIWWGLNKLLFVHSFIHSFMYSVKVMSEAFNFFVFLFLETIGKPEISPHVLNIKLAYTEKSK